MFFINEILFFSFFYYYGAQGMHAVFVLQKENMGVEQQVLEIKKEIAQLHDEITVWETDSFYKEKLAREQLNMAKSGEEIYLT